MASVAFGGGPSLDARMSFCNLRPGSQVPGYTGHIHQLKYNQAHTYGDHTHLLALERSKTAADFRASASSGINNFTNENLPYKSIQAALTNELPKPNGVNKLTENMLPGYTGYIPSRKFRFSNTYKNECDQSIDNYLNERKKDSYKKASLMSAVDSQNKFAPISTGNDLREKLATFEYNKTISDKREFTEPPIPGYKGYIPRLQPTDLGLGLRYREATERGLNTFKSEYLRSKTAGASLSSRSVSGFDYKPENATNQSVDFIQRKEVRRTFVKPGMVPKYTGHVHGFKYDIGKTYGNSTRDLPVCSHNYPNFGIYIEKNPNKTIVC